MAAVNIFIIIITHWSQNTTYICIPTSTPLLILFPHLIGPQHLHSPKCTLCKSKLPLKLHSFLNSLPPGQPTASALPSKYRKHLLSATVGQHSKLYVPSATGKTSSYISLCHPQKALLPRKQRLPNTQGFTD